MNDTPLTFDLSASGGPAKIAAIDLARHAMRAKTKVRASARGWSMLSQVEILALAWFADLFLEDENPADPPPEKLKPTVISEL